MALREDIEWLLSICQKPKDLKYLEPCAHAFSVFFSLQGNSPYAPDEIAKLSMVGIIATTARMNNEDKFHQLDPQSFLQVANILLDDEDLDGIRYNLLIGKIMSVNDINTKGEGETEESQT